MAGSLRKYTVQEADNAALGQAGSIFLTGDVAATAPPVNTAFVAITIIVDATFDNTTGLIPEDGATKQYIGTSISDSQTAGGASAAITSSITFPAGVTIYGRWSSIDLASGSVIAYIG